MFGFKKGQKIKEETVISTEEKKEQFKFDVGRIVVRFHFEDTLKHDFSKSFCGDVFPYHFAKAVKITTGKSLFQLYYKAIREQGYFPINNKTYLPFHALKSMSITEEPWIQKSEYALQYSERM